MTSSIIFEPQYPRFKERKRWFHVFIYTIFLTAGQPAATLLGRLYFDRGGKSKWIIAFTQSAGFPILIPLLFYLPKQKHAKLINIPHNLVSSETKPKPSTLFFLYMAFGLLITGNDLMYSYGLLYLPLSTYALICATQLGFNAIFSFFLNSQKFTALIINSIVLLTVSVSLLAISDDSEEIVGLPRKKHVLGFFFTLAASAIYSLHHSLVQLCFEKVLKSETFSAVLHMQLYPSMVATFACVVGLFASGEWKTLENEMKGFENGSVSYVMTLIWIAVSWQISAIGTLGLIFEVSSLFSIVIGTLEFPISPILAVIVFHDKINGVKVVALLLAIWGFLSYMYQHYVDEQKAKEDRNDALKV
ncbi:hypothetical protein RJT34_30929 [Clitoria ternatea]|uniref:Probable purine permease n=1 Tax=Clitoria ternatea TaxID=43366 RepID=A0AAN9EVH0_CLITE